METRVYIKEKAKELLNANYWRNVGLFVVLSLIGVAGGSGVSMKFRDGELKNLFDSDIPFFGNLLAISIILATLGTVYTLALIFNALVVNPLSCGVHKYTSELYRGKNPAFSVPFTNAFSENYLRKVGGILWMQLFIWLWSLLFIIPGIIKAFSYAATPYILARFPSVNATDALKLSMKLMDGRKADLFVFELSFIGWHMLNGLTLGFLGIFYVTPYYSIAKTGFFEEAVLSDLNSGRLSLSEFGEAM